MGILPDLPARESEFDQVYEKSSKLHKKQSPLGNRCPRDAGDAVHCYFLVFHFCVKKDGILSWSGPAAEW